MASGLLEKQTENFEESLKIMYPLNMTTNVGKKEKGREKENENVGDEKAKFNVKRQG